MRCMNSFFTVLDLFLLKKIVRVGLFSPILCPCIIVFDWFLSIPNEKLSFFVLHIITALTHLQLIFIDLKESWDFCNHKQLLEFLLTCHYLWNVLQNMSYSENV